MRRREFENKAEAKKSVMEIIQHQLLLHLLLLTYFLACTQAHSPASLNRTSFPTGFIFGAGSSAYQYEGAAIEHGRKPSIWDIFTRLQSDKIADRSNGDVAEGFYYRYKEDIPRVKEIGFDSFRFSISWPRLLPKGKISGGVNQQGVDFYNNLIDELLSNGILPFVTLFHWDLPQALEDEYKGFLSPKVVNDYGDYVDLCFKEFGDRVKHWVTLNEPHLFSSDGYGTGARAPGRCSNYIGNCMEGNSGIEPYTVTHHLILCHATAVRLYKDKYQASQKGTIGITVTTLWMVPKFQTVASKNAAARALDFSFGWIVHPIIYGDYPESMRCLVGSRLPNFTKSESQMVKGSFDFIGINYYTANYAEDDSSSPTLNLSYTTDSRVILSPEKNGIPLGQPTELSWLYIYPKGLQELMLYIKEKYQNPPIYITENGMADASNRSMPIKDALNDSLRIKYHYLHLWYLLKAMKDGVEVRGYYAWTFLDDFEWESGYTIRFGITYVDFIDGMKRYFKHSAFWFKNFLQKKNVTTKPLLFYQ